MIDDERARFEQARRERDEAFQAREAAIVAEEWRLRRLGLAIGYVVGVPVDAEIVDSFANSPTHLVWKSPKD